MPIMKPLGKVKIKWSPEFAYAIGLIVTDGSLSKDGRHISFTSKDIELINKFQKSLGINLSIGKKGRATGAEKKYFVVQIGDVLFYRFLEKIGLMPNKTKILKSVSVPNKYFNDFLRGHYDGDGSSYSYWDPRWRSSFMFYTSFLSASKTHINWLRDKIYTTTKIKGHITKSINSSCYQLKYAKRESVKILKKIYYSPNVVCLSRKRLKISRILDTIGEKL